MIVSNRSGFPILHISSRSSHMHVTDFFWHNVIHLFIAKMLNKGPTIVFQESRCVCFGSVCLAELNSLCIFTKSTAICKLQSRASHTRWCYTKAPLISKHGTWITSISLSNLFTAQRGRLRSVGWRTHRKFRFAELKWCH